MAKPATADEYLEQARRYTITVSAGSDATEPYVARAVEFPYTCGVGDTPEEAAATLVEMIADAVEVLVAEGRPVPAPLSGYTGLLHLRVPRSLHQALALRAAAEGVSLNAAAAAILAADLGLDPPPRRRRRVAAKRR